MILSLTPCFGCKDRYVRYDDDGKAHTCHSTCPRHAKQLEKNEITKKRKHEINAQNGVAHDSAERIRKKTGFYKKNK